MSIRRRNETGPRGIFGDVWRVVARIPRGKVATYGQVARMVGLPGGARTIGWAMSALPGDLRIGGRPIPWHRVINVQGRISRRGGSPSGDAIARQAARLRREGIEVSGDGGIDLKTHLWEGEARRPRRPVRRA
jgi:methylated-DNA-protein-cysteine methyltransferase related protein